MSRCVGYRTEKFSWRLSVAIIAALAVLSWLGVYELGSIIWAAL